MVKLIHRHQNVLQYTGLLIYVNENWFQDSALIREDTNCHTELLNLNNQTEKKNYGYKTWSTIKEVLTREYNFFIRKETWCRRHTN